MDATPLVDKTPELLYTETDLANVAQQAAQAAIQQFLRSPPNLDNRTEGDLPEKEDSMYRETYTYLDENGEVQTKRISGTSKRDTDAKFRDFLLKPKEKPKAPTLRQFVEQTYAPTYINGLAIMSQTNYSG